MSSFATCRLCGKTSYEPNMTLMIHYSVRHHAHADCALKRWGAKFFDRLQAWQLRRFPTDVAKAYGLEKELRELRLEHIRLEARAHS